ncbi:Uncharacterised protein [Bordetella pertussis]|nr:Uncharacterised protein [Bordetella pertussis]
MTSQAAPVPSIVTSTPTPASRIMVLAMACGST